MPELLIELFSEEIPARMQARAAEDFCGLLLKALAPLMTEAPRPLYGPRRIAATGSMAARAETAGREERGPRIGAPEAALDGFLRKHGATRAELKEEGQFWVLQKPGSVIEAAMLLAEALPPLLRNFPWPKSMRWGTSDFAWVRPLQRILCVFDGQPVYFSLAHGEDAVHGLASAALTEGHRIMAGTEPFVVTGLADYLEGLRSRRVIADPAERERLIEQGIAALAAAEGLEVVPDRGLLAEVAGLVEWPVPLLGGIDAAFMDLPPEVMRTTMRVNQRYFALRTPDGRAAPRFALVSNITPGDGGAAIIAGNERVLRARLSDARFFWDQDQKQKLEDFLPKLDFVVFHASLGTQRQRVGRLEWLAASLAPFVGAEPKEAARAARLAKADLVSGMVGEFPELQGVMGKYYAQASGETAAIAAAIEAHYRPLGPGDAVPAEPVSISVALADKLDQLTALFAVNEKPSGSGDPYALRRAALGVIRTIKENRLRMQLRPLLLSSLQGLIAASLSNGYGIFPDWWSFEALEDIRIKGGLGNFVISADLLSDQSMSAFRFQLRGGNLSDSQRRFSDMLDSNEAFGLVFAANSHPAVVAADVSGTNLALRTPEQVATEVLDFLFDRLRVQLRTEGARHDLVAAVFGATPDDDLTRLLARAAALEAMLATEDGQNLLAAYKRAANILRIETRKDGPHTGPVDPARLTAGPEQSLYVAVTTATNQVANALATEDFRAAMAALATLRTPVDAFFTEVVVNDPDPDLRRNRLRLLGALCAATDAVADFSKIEG